jgi:hypothetical protein
MQRKDSFFALHDKLQENSIHVIMVQIEEAHTDLWPVGRDYQPTNHTNMEDRVNRANQFIKDYDCPYNVYVDGFDNKFETLFRAWPDKYYFLDENMKVLYKSSYGKKGQKDGKVLLDYVNLLNTLV